MFRDEPWRSAICRVYVKGALGESTGTGTLVRTPNGPLVLTALHVVTEGAQLDTPICQDIQVRFYRTPLLTARVACRDGRPLLDRSRDWVLLHVPDPATTDLANLGLAYPDLDRPFSCVGFPTSNPSGLTLIGRIATLEHRADFDAAVPNDLPLMQARCAGAEGLVISGISGAACLTDGLVTGIITSALVDGDGRVTGGGTLYGVSITEIVAGASGALEDPDPCAGLSTTRRSLTPAVPFRYLRAYGPDDVAVFFGRCRELRYLIQWVAQPGSGLLLIYGPSGVGKSSLVGAGLLPRVQDCVCEAWEADLQVAAFGSARVCVVDQAELAMASGDTDPILTLVETLLRSRRVIVVLRKEWLSETRTVLAHLSPTDFPLHPLGERAIVETVNGLARPDLHQVYGLTVEPGLGERVASFLRSSSDGPVAPFLQILLSEMWSHVAGVDNRRWDATLWEAVRSRTDRFEVFLFRQLNSANAQASSQGVSHGLLLSLLHDHVSHDERSRICGRSDLSDRYCHVHEGLIDAAIGVLSRTWLLTLDEQRQSSALAHDTLGPLVRRAWRESQLPGPRAGRILDGRLSDAEGAPAFLSESELELVLVGLSQIPVLDTRSCDFVRLSGDAVRRKRRLRGVLQASGLVAVLVVVVVAGAFAYLSLQTAALNRSIVQQTDRARIESLSARLGPVWRDVAGLEKWIAEAEAFGSPIDRHEVAPWWASSILNVTEDSAELRELSVALHGFVEGPLDEARRQLALLQRREDEAQAIHDRLWFELLRAMPADADVLEHIRAEHSDIVPLGLSDRGVHEFLHLPTSSAEELDAAAEGLSSLATRVRSSPPGEGAIVLVLVAGGRYQVGALDEAGYVEKYWDCVKDVELDPFLISKYELTQWQWMSVRYSNPSANRAGTDGVGLGNPVENVSWFDASRFVADLHLALPSEAQWEVAARAGTTTDWWCGSDAACAGGAGQVKGEGDASLSHHSAVGVRGRGNAFGVFDTIGNVWEWSGDGFCRCDLELVDGEGARPCNSGSAVFKGGSFYSPANNAAASVRRDYLKSFSHPGVGFRPAVTVGARRNQPMAYGAP